MKVTFETDTDGYVTINGSIKGSSFHAKGKIALIEDEEQLFKTLRRLSREVSNDCPSDFMYSQSGVGK